MTVPITQTLFLGGCSSFESGGSPMLTPLAVSCCSPTACKLLPVLIPTDLSHTAHTQHGAARQQRPSQRTGCGASMQCALSPAFAKEGWKGRRGIPYDPQHDAKADHRGFDLDRLPRRDILLLVADLGAEHHGGPAARRSLAPASHARRRAVLASLRHAKLGKPPDSGAHHTACTPSHVSNGILSTFVIDPVGQRPGGVTARSVRRVPLSGDSIEGADKHEHAGETSVLIWL